MTEPTTDAPAGGGVTAGALLRRARQAQGLHIAALAATIKVTPRKLESLESDRYDELPDATFTRALAQAVCRTLKIDPAPVLALLPQSGGHRLDHVAEGINAPFREHGRAAPADEWSVLLRPAVVIPALVALAAAVVFFLPAGTLTTVSPSTGAASAPRAAASVAQRVEPMAVVGIASSPAAAAVVPAAAPASSAPASLIEAAPPAATPPATTLQLRASAPSWIEVVDASGQPLISRIVAAGEVVDLDGALPLKLRIGNAGATQVAFRGQAVELGLYTRDNVARFELK
jgi:cytoskeleton protein RodZ